MAGLRSRTTARFMGNVATVFFGIVIALQLLLALGMLPITMAWGGQQSVLTPGLRVASVAAVAILAGMAYVIRRRAGLIGTGEQPSVFIKVLAWIVTAYVGLNLLGNLTSPSAGERLLFGSITAVLLPACGLVSMSDI
mmetsp:Transcript_41395/g.101831  ORF Transcript_41395/g.101831 Transcript_41395/m.101831 type:complete len:138 (+) Transcript_41395:148-561(+)